MATYGPHHQSRWLQALPPLTLEDPLSPNESDYPSAGNHSLISNTELVYTSHDSILPEDLFTKGFIPPYNPMITNPLGPLLIQVSLVPSMSSTIPIPIIPSMTNGSWDFVDTFGPLSLPQSIVSCFTKYCHHDILQSVWVYHHSHFPPMQVLNLNSSCQAFKNERKSLKISKTLVSHFILALPIVSHPLIMSPVDLPSLCLKERVRTPVQIKKVQVYY